MEKKSIQLRRMLSEERTSFLMEAHNGLSARIVEEAGFHGIWASGLSIAASMGVRDANEASWTQVVETAEFMSDRTNIPILLDGDTGFGNFNNFRRLVRKLEQREIAGVCIEDKVFPKSNSFVGGPSSDLTSVSEFCGKIKAGKDVQRDSSFVVVARTEALIVGAGMDEALHRAESYQAAGADAILIHSKKSNAEEVLTFLDLWNGRCPIVVVPTTYYDAPTQEFERRKVSLVIWANQLLRSSVRNMQETARRIFLEKSIAGVEPDIASVKEIFRLQDMAELAKAEDLYLCKGKDGM